MTRYSLSGILLLVLVCACPFASATSAQTPPPTAPTTPANELDAFMAKVLARREVNRQTLQQYVLDEIEQVEVFGPNRMSVFRQKREYTWYVRDGLHVRSPVRFDGVSVGETERAQYEASWAKRERGRLARKEEDAKKKGTAASEPEPSEDPAVPSGSPVPTPRFVSEAYFMDFKFDPGNYYLVGREQLDGQTVLRIEYYPKRMFNDDNDRERDDRRGGKDQKDERRDNAKERAFEERIDRQMNKTALITLWVDPSEHQIVKYTFDNVWMDFLPGAWLVRVDDIRASMTMGQPFPGVWLPREMDVQGGVTLASGSLKMEYGRRFSDYKQADVATKIRIPKLDARAEPCCSSSLVSYRIAEAVDTFEPSVEALENDPIDSGPAATTAAEPDEPQTPSGPAEVVSEIRVHGNAYLRDDEVIRLAGVGLGQAIGADGVQAIEQRLRASGFFESVEVRKRYRSLDSTTDIAIVLLVHERPGQRSETADKPPSIWPWSRAKSRLMFLPILGYDDGYGLTYGARFSTIDLLGAAERISVPLTWGGTRRAAVEVERTFERGPLTRVESTFGITQRENPRFEIDDRRVAWTARAERSIAGLVRAGVDTSQSTVAFGDLDDRLWTVGANAVLDTRGAPGFPRNAVYLGAGWSGLHVRGLERINRWTADARGYAGVIGQAVLAGRVQYDAADRTLPPYERLLLGGASTLRGFETGAFEGDRRFVTSAELRVPITSVLNGSKFGVTAFIDAGKIFDAGQRMKDAVWHRGVGGGVFLIATIIRLNLDVAHGLNDGDTRVHFGTGFGF